MRRFSFLSVLGGIAAGLVFLVVGLLFFFRFDPDAYDGKTTGTISRIEESTEWVGEDRQINHQVYVDYTADGREFRGAEYGSYNSSMKEGDEVEIYYMTAQPENITGPGNQYVPWLGLGAAILGGLIIVADIVGFIRRRA